MFASYVWNEAQTEATLAPEDGVPGVAEIAPGSSPPHINAATPQARAVLGYLSANCGVCHRTPGPLANVGLNFRQLAYDRHGERTVVTTALNRATRWDLPSTVPGTTKALLAGEPEQSALLQRMRSRRPSSQMPPLGTVLQDKEAVDAVSAWITSLAAGQGTGR